MTETEVSHLLELCNACKPFPSGDPPPSDVFDTHIKANQEFFLEAKRMLPELCEWVLMMNKGFREIEKGIMLLAKESEKKAEKWNSSTPT